METDSKVLPEANHLTVKQKEDVNDDYNELPPPPDGGYGWVIVVASFMCNMVVDGIGYSFGIFLTEIADYYGENKGKTAWVGSLLTGMCMCAGPLASTLANKFGCRIVCTAGCLLSSIAFVVSIYSPNVIWLMLSYGFIGGIGFGLIYLPAVVCVGYYFESKRSLATGIAVCGSGVGTFAFAPLATILLEAYGWRGANLVFAGIIFSCGIFGALMRPLEYTTTNKGQEIKDNASTTPFQNTLGPIKSSSHGTIANSIHDMRKRMDSTGSYMSRNINEVESSAFTSKLSLSSRNGLTIQPLARKDVFYSGSIANLKEFQSQKSLASYRQSVLNIPNISNRKRQESDNSYMSLLKDPVFLLIGIASLFGMAAVYIPFVYIVDCAKADGIEAGKASVLLSIIGITNTLGRIACGYFADFPQVNALFVNNICLVMAAVSVGLTPFCNTYIAYTSASVIFAIALSGYISLTSIILVDLLGLDKLTNAFGLLILFRGAAALVGSPLAGALFDATQSYDIPFYVAGILFGISAAISFMVPCGKRCLPSKEQKSQGDDEAPINENNK